MEEDAEERDGGVDVWATRGDTATDSSSRFGFGLGRIFGTDRCLPGYAWETHRMVYPLGGIVLLKTQFRLLNF